MDLQKLMEMEEFQAKLKGTQSVEEVAALVNSYGVAITEAEIERAMTEAATGELTEEELENVAGGILARPALVYAFRAALLILCGRSGQRISSSGLSFGGGSGRRG